MKEQPTSKQLLSLKKKTAWSWEKMCREFHSVMGQEGPSHTTLFRYATGKTKRQNKLTERYVKEAIDRITAELVRKKLKSQQKEEIRFHELLKNTQDLVYRFRRDPLGCEYINPAAKDMLGYTPDEFYADPQLALKIVHPDDKVGLEVNFQDTSTLRATRRWIHKNGKVIRCEEVYVPVHDEDGNLVAVEGIAREIPDRK